MSYTLGLIHNDELHLSSLFFTSVDSAQQYISNIGSNSFQILELSDTNNATTQLDGLNNGKSYNKLEGMFLYKYGKGYLLKCDENDASWGTKYYHNGWWMPTQNGWFFKAEFVDNLIKLGAQIWNNKIAKSNTIKKETDNLTGMILSLYGKGYLLKCASYDSRWGEKYFLTGWWMPNQEGWFFKNTEFEYLTELGATYAENIDDYFSEDEPTKFTIKNAKWSQYGKGWLLTPKNDHPEFGEKYFNGGWWMPNKNGWFFKNAEKSKLDGH